MTHWIKTYFLLLLGSISLVSAHPCLAAEQSIKPLHIKIGEQAKASSFKIHNSNLVNNNRAPSGIKQSQCIETTPEKQNQYKKLADSIKLYMNVNNRNPMIVDAIYNASAQASIDFELMLVKAMIESNLGQNVMAENSSARGLYQFIDSTWLVLLHRHADRIGQIEISKSLYTDKNKRVLMIRGGSQFTKDALLNLRHDLHIASLIKAYQTKEEAKILANLNPDKRLSATDHYIVHMLGLTQARKFFDLMRHMPHAVLTEHGFETAARVNPHFFYDQSVALTAAGAYKRFHSKITKQYVRLRELAGQYGSIADVSSDCALPSVQTSAAHQVVADEAKKQKKESAALSAIAALKGNTYKVEMVKD